MLGYKDTVNALVALRKESVDRNESNLRDCNGNIVALRKESVDRNNPQIFGYDRQLWSLSARRAWIEIIIKHFLEGCKMSLSARRAWIEIERKYAS